jgi:hypothetical protein
MKTILTVFIAFCLLACSPFRRTTFTYTSDGKTFSQPVLVPKGYRKTNHYIDSAGNTLQTYDYKNRAFYYIAYVQDTNSFVQPLQVFENIPKIYLNSGAWLYKGMDHSHLFWKEVHRKHLRAGYLYVDKEREYAFDSASTHIAVMPLQ